MSASSTKAGGMISDGSWTLTVFVTDLQVERTLRVRGDLHIGGVMIRLVDELGKKIVLILMQVKQRANRTYQNEAEIDPIFKPHLNIFDHRRRADAHLLDF